MSPCLRLSPEEVTNESAAVQLRLKRYLARAIWIRRLPRTNFCHSYATHLLDAGPTFVVFRNSSATLICYVTQVYTSLDHRAVKAGL
jgi:site-specific recombinase XerC